VEDGGVEDGAGLPDAPTVDGASADAGVIEGGAGVEGGSEDI
jgi:hypothetical protein